MVLIAMFCPSAGRGWARLRLFPQDLVGKRCEKGEKKFLKDTFQQIAQHVGLIGKS